MKIPNPTGKTLEELQSSLAIHYPGTVIKKPFIGPRFLKIPSNDMKHIVRDKKQNVITDFIPPVLVVIAGIIISIVLVSIVMSFIYGQLMLGIGGALWVILGMLIVKDLSSV